jgi:hypothetical protein
MRNKNNTILFHLFYLIPGTVSSIMYFNFFYKIFDASLDLPREIENVVGFIFLIPWVLFYLMGLTFTILLHPIAVLFFFIIKLKKENISIGYIIIFIWSMVIAFIYLYLIWGKGLYLTV